MSSMPESTCRACLAPFHPYPMGDKNGFKLEGCRSCGSVLANPWPKAEDIEKYYGDVQPEAVHVSDPERETSYIAKQLVKRLGPAKQGARFLDVVARQGYAVVAAEKLGYKARGLNSLEYLARFAAEKNGTERFEEATLQDYAARGEKADVILSVEAFCEQTDLEGFTAALAASLDKGGVIYIEEPDGNHFNAPRDFAFWRVVDPPASFGFISKKGMEKLLGRHGLKIKKSFFTWVPYMRLLVVKK